MKYSHAELIRITAENMKNRGYEVFTSVSKLRKSGIKITIPLEAGYPDIIAIKQSEILIIDIVLGTYASEMVDKILKYGRLGRVVFVFPTETLKNVSFWSMADIGLTTNDSSSLSS